MRPVSVLGFEVCHPGLLGRCSWEIERATADAQLMAWVGRFRFVTAQAIATRFGVSWQQANSRVRRLERLGIFGFERQHVSQPRAVFLTGRGHDLLGWPRRRAPRADTQREHEAAIVHLVTELEREDPGARVLSERECRRLEAPEQGLRYSVDVHGVGGHRDRCRWPDAVVELAGTRRAIEIEFAPKGTDRLRGIVQGYENSAYEEATFFVESAALGRRIKRLAGQSTTLRTQLGMTTCAIVVRPWIQLSPDQRSALANGLAR